MSELAGNLDALWAVHHLDAQIAGHLANIARNQRADATEQAKVSAAQKRVDAAALELRQLKLKQRDLEQELQALDTRVTQLEAQGTVAGSDAAQRQRLRVNELEDQGLELLSQISAQEEQLKKAEAELAARKGEQAIAAEAHSATNRQEQAALDALAIQRTAATSVVPEELLHVYEEVQARNPGTAMARAKDGYCSACQGELRQQLIVQIKHRAEIIRCPHCQRILDA